MSNAPRWPLGILALAAAVALLLVARSCQPEPTVKVPLTVAPDRVVTVDTAGHPAPSSAPTVAQLAVSPGRGVVTVTGNRQPVTVQQQAPAVRVVQQSPAGRQTVVAETSAGPAETAVVPGDSDEPAMVITSQPEPVVITIKAPEPSRVGVIAGALPGWVALDVAVIRGRPLQPLGLDVAMSLDVMGNFQAIGAGVAVGDKVFATAGGCVEWSGRPGWYAGVGVRF